MKKHSYHRIAYEHYNRNKRWAIFFVYGSLFYFYFMVILNPRISLPSINEFIEGRLNDVERMGILQTIFSVVTLAAGCMLLKLSTAGLMQIKLSEIELLKNYILITAPSTLVWNKFPEKSFIRLSYDEIQKIDWEEEYKKGQKKNFTIYHKNGCIELCIEDPEAVAYDIDEYIRKIKGMKKKSGQESCDQELFCETDEKAENELSDEGDSLSLAIREEKENFLQNQTKCTCPHCRKEFFVLKGAKKFVCPYCEKQIEFFQLK